uniref:Major sperm protein n=1 Tax=Heterorhabditis bacteriophora TaxID=37862 RepID=A0A1I7XMI0_HETBA
MNSNYLLGQGSKEEVENLTIGISLVCAQVIFRCVLNFKFLKKYVFFNILFLWYKYIIKCTIEYLQNVDNEPRSTGFVVNIDAVYHPQKPWFTYDQLLIWTEERKNIILPFTDEKTNMKQTKDMTEWDRIMMVTPYREKEAEVFIDEMSCANDPQKSDCSLLASCRGINIEPPSNDNKENYEYDPCEGNDVLIFTIEKRKQALKFVPFMFSLIIFNNYVIICHRVEPDRNYRIVIKEGAFDTNTEEIRWRVSLHDVNLFDPTKSCLEQGIVVHPNRKDLMLMKLSKRDLRKRIEATLKDGTKVAAQLEHRTKGGTVKHQPYIIIWGLVVLAFLASLVSFIIVIHRTRVQRITIVVKNKGRKDYMETSNVL